VAAKAEAATQRVALQTIQKAKNTKKTLPSTTTLKHARSGSTAESSDAAAPKKAKQSMLKTYTGHDMPFSGSEADAVQAQALRAIVSSNSPFSLFEDPEMLTLLGMLRSQAPGIIPTRRVLSGRLLDEASTIVHQKLSQILAGEALGLVYVIFLVQSPY
jgi:hypothetical protein